MYLRAHRWPAQVLGLALVFFCLKAAASAAAPVITVERMTCAQAQKYVKKYGMYWIATENDGPIPITHVAPADQSRGCEGGQIYSYHRRVTLDDSRCIVGITCRSASFVRIRRYNQAEALDFTDESYLHLLNNY